MADEADLALQALTAWGAVAPPTLIKARENIVFRAQLANGQPAALRLHRPGYHSLTAILSEHAFMAEMAQAGLSVPQALATRQGESFVTVGPKGVVADLLTWQSGDVLDRYGEAPGRSPSHQVALFKALGSQLAGLHRAADRVPASLLNGRPRWDLAGLTGPSPTWGPYWENPYLDEAQRAAVARARALAAERLAAMSATADLGPIHGDLVGENVLVDGDRVSLIDFDDFGYGYRAFDIATVLNRSVGAPHFEALLDAMRDGYCAVRRLSEAEWRALPLFMMVRSLVVLGWVVPRAAELGEDTVRRFAADAMVRIALAEAA